MKKGIFQISLDDCINDNAYDKLLTKLECYKIDEYYKKHFRGKTELLKKIKNALSDLPKYKEYQQKLLKMLQQYFKNNEEIEVIYYEVYDYIRINEPKQSYPLFCLAMINKKIL